MWNKYAASSRGDERREVECHLSDQALNNYPLSFAFAMAGPTIEAALFHLVSESPGVLETSRVNEGEFDSTPVY